MGWFRDFRPQLSFGGNAGPTFERVVREGEKIDKGAVKTYRMLRKDGLNSESASRVAFGSAYLRHAELLTALGVELGPMRSHALLLPPTTPLALPAHVVEADA